MIGLQNKCLLSKNLDKVKDKKILVRVDLNVENPSENYRIDIAKNLLPCLRKARQIIYISHRGQPKNYGVKYSLKTFTKHLPHFKFFNWAPEKKSPKDKFLLFENLRFFEEEEKNDSEFSKKLADLADVYINEAFSASHREHASIVGISKFLPSYFGINFEKEIKNLNKVFECKNGLAIAIGGAKIETKVPIIEKFLKKADLIVLGGLTAKEFINKKLMMSNKIQLPIKPVSNDTDKESIEMFLEKLKNMKMIVWNGPFGKIESKKFEKGTLLFAKGLAKTKNFRIIGGGDTISFLYKHKLQNKFDFISTGGGAMLDYLAKETLPGIEAIQNS